MLRRMTRSAGWRAALAMIVMLLAVSLVHAQTKPEETSLQFVPADVGFYVTMLRNREQWEILKNSKAYAKLQQNPFIQLGIFQFRQQWANPENPELAELKTQLEKPENQQLVNLLTEAGADEIFFYGDSRLAKQIALINRLNQAQQMAQIEAAGSDRDPEELTTEKITTILNESSEDLQVPVFVIGARIKDKQAATTQLQRLEELLKLQFEENEQPELAERLKRSKIGDGDYLVLTLDGSMIPWDDVRENVEETQHLDTLIEKLKQKTVAIAVGTHDSYLVLSVGPDTNHLAELGEGKKLAAREEFAQLKKHLGERITSIGYASSEFVEQISNLDQQLDSLKTLARTALPLAELDDASEQKAFGAVESLVDTLKKQLPRPGAALAITFLSDRGYEEYSYDWTKNSNFDASKPLSILKHTGSRPLLLVAGRTKYQPKNYDQFVQIVKQAYEAGNEIALEKLNDEEKPEYERLRDKLLPLAGRLDKVLREQFLPGFADSQTALVIDADLTSRQLQSMIPESNVDLPVPEIAIVCGVSNAELVRGGAREIFHIAQEVIDAVREVAPEEVPPIEVPSPQVEDADGAQIYSYALPEAWGIDAQVSPNAALSENTLVLSMAPATSKRLLIESDPVSEGVLAEAANRPLAAVSFFDVAGWIDTIVPWVRYGVAVSQDTDVASVVLPVQDLIDVARCFQNVTAVTYQEGSIWVTHSEYYFRDLEE